MKVFMAAVFASGAHAGMQLSPSHTAEQRRLDVLTDTSTNDTASASCIVGGYDEDNPRKIYVGGPCSGLNAKHEPTAAFRWVEMETVDIELLSGKNEVDLDPFGSPFVHSQSLDTHMEVGVSNSFRVASGGVAPNAALFASTTSYLAKKTISYNDNSFVIGKTGNSYDTVSMCVKECCAAPGTAGCACTGKTCPTEKLTAEPGDFKYSLMAAMHDEDGAVSTAAGNGWLRMVAEYGEGTPKALKGSLNIYQAMDFTNMKADTLTLTSSDKATTTLYKDMTECDLSGNATCTTYSVGSIALAAETWEGVKYAFPQTYNHGTYAVGSTGTITTVPEGTMAPKIVLVKPTAKNIANLLSDSYATEILAKAAKVVLIMYTFDISGGTATNKGGTYMVYDPTVNTASAAATKDAAKGAGLVAAGRVASLPALLVLAMSALIMSM